MAHYIILDSGHAKVTAGKRSPDSNLMEWEFNNDMQYRLKARLEQLGFVVYLVNPNPEKGAEVSLSNRCSKANSYWAGKGKPADTLYVSLHANAAGSGGWSTARGVEVYTSVGCSSKSASAAKKICAAIYKDVYAIDKGFKNRGHKSNNFYVVKNTNMPGVLIEYAFYTNKQDLVVLKNNRAELAEATVKALCQCFNMPYKAAGAEPKQEPFTVKVIYTGKEGLNIRKQANLSSAVVGQVFEGQVFTILEVVNGMGKLKSGVGWISLGAKYVKRV